jgi:glycosyltransferase 2 family protein
VRVAAIATLITGLAFTVVLVVYFGADAVLAALKAAGFAGLIAISLMHLVATALMGLAWWLLVSGQAPARPWLFIWARLVRDSGSEILPLSQVGGYVLGARALILHGVGGALTAASTVVDVTLELCGQIVFTALGIGLLLLFRPGTTLAEPLLLGLAFAVVVVAAFVVVQRRGAHLLERWTLRLAGRRLGAIAQGAEAMRAALHDIYRRRGRLWACFLLHLLAWLWTAAEAWLALRLMKAPLGIGPVLAIESLLYAIRSAAFIVPNALGVQEGAYVMLGAIFGLMPETALGLSLLKRGRDLMLGVPALLAWQVFESRRLVRRPLDESGG